MAKEEGAQRTVGSAGQQTLSPESVTLPNAAALFDPAQLGLQETLW